MGGPYSLLGRGRWVVSADVTESDTHYNVEVDVPGLKKEDVKVRVEDSDNRVCISGQRARPPYHKWIQGDSFGDNKNGFSESRYESTFTSIDEHGNIVSKTTSKNDADKATSNKIAVTQYDKEQDKTPRPLLIEKDFGEFERCFSFPRRIIRDSTSAELENGVLTLSIEKANGSGDHNVSVRSK
eukprot:GDKK01048446.1.p1 GENE.GDKK01048446.1~~GDKK01048446.1.p1  ORF type:complete len:184 (+),score=20.64 GDKK01048446.1:1-552(+)